MCLTNCNDLRLSQYRFALALDCRDKLNNAYLSHCFKFANAMAALVYCAHAFIRLLIPMAGSGTIGVGSMLTADMLVVDCAKSPVTDKMALVIPALMFTL